MTRPFRLVVLCHANVARSAAAAYLLDGATDERGVPVEVRSAGTHATEGQPASGRTRGALRAQVDAPDALDAHRAHLIDADDVAWADLVIAMEGSQVRFVRRVHPDGAAKTATLAVLARWLPADGRSLAHRVGAMELATLLDGDDDDVIDPAGGDEETYERTVAELVALCTLLRGRLAAEPTSDE